MWILDYRENSTILKEPTICIVTLDATTEEQAIVEAQGIIDHDKNDGRIDSVKLYEARLVKDMTPQK